MFWSMDENLKTDTSPTSCLQTKSTKESDIISREGPVSIAQPGIVQALSGLVMGLPATMPTTKGSKHRHLPSIPSWPPDTFCWVTMDLCSFGYLFHQSCREYHGMGRQTWLVQAQRQKRSLCMPFPGRTTISNSPSTTLSCTKCLEKAALGRYSRWSDSEKKAQKIQIVNYSFLRQKLQLLFPGVFSRAKKKQAVLCSEVSEERCGADGWRCGVYHGGEEGPLFSLGKSLPHAPLLHLPDQGKRSV